MLFGLSETFQRHSVVFGRDEHGLRDAGRIAVICSMDILLALPTSGNNRSTE